jgi:hypothetical protein
VTAVQKAEAGYNSSDQQDSTIQMIQFPFCLLFEARSWVTVTV